MSRGLEDPEECLDMAKQKKQTSEAAVREIEDQAENDGTKKEGVPGREGGLGRSQKPSPSEERAWSRIL